MIDDHPGPVLRYVGWIRVGMNLEWRMLCSASTREFCEDLVRKARPTKKIWSESVILPKEETPFCSIRLGKDGYED